MSWSRRIENPVFAERLKQERRKRKLTQQALADLCGLGIDQIGRYEAGDREPSLMGLFKIAEVLDVSTDYLLGLTDNPHEKLIAFDLDPYEREMVDTYRREGWRGVVWLGAERIAK